MSNPKRVLILSYSPIRRDPRVLRQIHWIAGSSTPKPEISVYGLGDFNEFSNGTYTQLESKPVFYRLISYLFMPPEKRQNLALHTFHISDEIQKIESGQYDSIILNDLDFIGYDQIFDSANESRTPVYVDLHEYFFDFGGSLFFRTINSRYYKWLLEKLALRSVDSYFTVSEAIADLYQSLLPSRPIAIMNTSAHETVVSSHSDAREEEQKIRLVYHGAAGKGRGIVRLIRAMRHVGDTFELNLILVGSLFQRVKYLALTFILGVRKKVVFHKPVDFVDITSMLQGFDIQVIFYHPPHSTNEKYSLPNKFFESARAGLAFILGDSSSMRLLVEEYNAGWITSGWSHIQLAETINSVSARDLIEKKKNSRHLSMAISSESQREIFLRTLNLK